MYKGKRGGISTNCSAEKKKRASGKTGGSLKVVARSVTCVAYGEGGRGAEEAFASLLCSLSRLWKTETHANGGEREAVQI